MAQDRAQRVGAWQREKLLPKAEAERRYLEAVRIAPELEQLAGEDFTLALETADAAIRETAHVERTSRIQRQILGAESTSVADGIETPQSRQERLMVRLLDVLDPPETAPDMARVIARSESRPVTGEQIRKALLAEGEPAYEIVKDGKVIRTSSVDTAAGEATGARERAEREAAEARAESLLGLPLR